MSKRGVIEGVTIYVILIAFTLVVLIFAVTEAFGNSNVTKQQTCHFSVLSRATVPAGQEFLELKCSTEQICITGGYFGKCAQFGGDNEVRRVNVDTLSGHERGAAEVIEKTLADAMYDCWRMMGEGRIDVFAGSGIFEVSKPQCVICSRVAIDTSTIGPSITDLVNVDQYMATHSPDDSKITYLHLFTDRGISSFAAVSGDDVRHMLRSTDVAFVFSQVRTRDPADAAFSVVKGGGVVGGFVLGGAGASLALVPALGSVVSAVALPAAILWVAGVGTGAGVGALAAYESQSVAAGYCGEVTSGDPQEKAKLGCSLVKSIHWDDAKINAFCPGGIKGNLP